MKKNLLLTLAALAMFMGFAVNAEAPAKDAAKDQKLVGTLALAKADDAAAGYVLKVDEKTTVTVTVDATAKDLVLKDLVGKKVEVTGVVTEKDGAKAIAAKTATEVKEEAAK